MWGRTSWPVPLPASRSPPCSGWRTQNTDVWADSRRPRTRQPMAEQERTQTSRLCRPLPAPGPGCWARLAAPGYPAGSEKHQVSSGQRQLERKGLLLQLHACLTLHRFSSTPIQVQYECGQCFARQKKKGLLSRPDQSAHPLLFLAVEMRNLGERFGRGFPTCLMVMAGLQSLSSSRMDKHTVPDG